MEDLFKIRVDALIQKLQGYTPAFDATISEVVYVASISLHCKL